MDKAESVLIFVHTMIHDVTRNKWTATVTLSSVSYYYIYQFSKKDLEAKFDTDFLFLTYSFLSFQLNKLKLRH